MKLVETLLAREHNIDLYGSTLLMLVKLAKYQSLTFVEVVSVRASTPVVSLFLSPFLYQFHIETLFQEPSKGINAQFARASLH